MRSDGGEVVRNLEQLETGELRRLQCSSCGQRGFVSLEQLYRHQLGCAPAAAESVPDLKAC